ncbi:MAG: hypothetical protein AABW58_01990 [Nanoarchaeota archaeon]
MKIKNLFLNWQVILLILILISMLFAINPKFSAQGIEVASVSGDAFEAGLRENDKIFNFNNVPVNEPSEFAKLISQLQPSKEQTIKVETSEKEVSFKVTHSLGFKTNNLTITSVDQNIPLELNSKIISINNKEIKNDNDITKIENDLIKKTRYSISTDKGEIIYLSSKLPEISVKEIEKSNIKKGLDLVGGTRVLLKPEEILNEEDIESLTKILSNRLDVYGLSDIRIRPAKDLSGEIFILAEIAGATKEEVTSLIAQQGKFEARVNNQTVFEGGKKDITYVCRDDGSCSGIVPPCSQTAQSSTCRFEFQIRLSPEAAKRHALITKEIPVSLDGYLEHSLDLYLDDELVDSLRISSSLKGQEATSISISGPGFGLDQEAAYQDALKNMDKLQTVLITGSLPQKLEIIKLDSISPLLGEEFTKNILLTTLFAFLGVLIVMFIRYRKLKIVLPILITMLSEIIIILGFASLIQWNLDLVSIAGIIAAVGTGVDAQIVIIDETLKKEQKNLNWKSKIKNAFFIIFAAFATTTVAMIPLWYAGAGLVRGLAFTTIVGITAGVFITRPTFGKIIEQLMKED